MEEVARVGVGETTVLGLVDVLVVCFLVTGFLEADFVGM